MPSNRQHRVASCMFRGNTERKNNPRKKIVIGWLNPTRMSDQESKSKNVNMIRHTIDKTIKIAVSMSFIFCKPTSGFLPFVSEIPESGDDMDVQATKMLWSL